MNSDDHQIFRPERPADLRPGRNRPGRSRRGAPGSSFDTADQERPRPALTRNKTRTTKNRAAQKRRRVSKPPKTPKGPRTNPLKASRATKVAGVVALLLAVVGGALYFGFILPAQRAEAEWVASRWRQVEVWARGPSICRGDASRLRRALETLEADRYVIEGALEDPVTRDDVPFTSATFPEEASTVVDAMIDWHTMGGGLGINACESPAEVLDLLLLGRVLMAAAPEVRPEAAATASRLAWLLESCGNLIEVAVGFNLHESLFAMADTWSLPSPPFERDTLPEADAPFFGLARDQVCMHDWAKETIESGRALNGLQQVAFSPEAEFLKLEGFLAERFLRAHAVRDQPEEVAAIFTWADDDVPDGALVEMMMPNFGGILNHLAEVYRTGESWAEELDRPEDPAPPVTPAEGVRRRTGR